MTAVEAGRSVSQRAPVPPKRSLFKLLRPAMKKAALALPVRMREQVSIRIKLGYWPNLDEPRTFNEKMCWRKLNDRSPRFVELSDKLAVRRFVQERIGAQHLTKLYAAIKDPAELNLESLPTSFVAKGSHDSGSVKIVKDKATLDPEEFRVYIRETLQKSGRRQLHNEWWYNQIPPRVLIEELLWDKKHGVPHDYKCFCFDGKVQMIVVDEARFENHLRSFYTRDWQLMPLVAEYPAAPLRSPPKNLDDLVQAAEKLSQGFDFVRVDLYGVDEERVVFGEMTFAPWGGWAPFTPISWDAKLGSFWTLPGKGRP